MNAKFEAFKTALEALCIEHGIYLRNSDYYDGDATIYVEEATEGKPAGFDLELEACLPPSPEEIAAEEARKARRAAEDAEWRAKWEAKWDGSYIKHHFALLDSMSLEEKQAMIAANAEEQRKKHMRVTRIPGDHNDIGERPCRVHCNEVEIEGWTVADDFRRVVETPGKVHHGAVRIVLAPEIVGEWPIVYGTVVMPDGRVLTEETHGWDAPQRKEKAAKPDIHTPARKRKAGK